MGVRELDVPAEARVGGERLVHEPALDGLRGLAVAAVVVFHLGHLRGGFLGVDLFFVLSGFLITSLLVMERRRRGGIDLPHFWSRRARRLLPALFVLLAGVALLVLVPSPSREGRPWAIAVHQRARRPAPWATGNAPAPPGTHLGTPSPLTAAEVRPRASTALAASSSLGSPGAARPTAALGWVVPSGRRASRVCWPSLRYWDSPYLTPTVRRTDQPPRSPHLLAVRRPGAVSGSVSRRARAGGGAWSFLVRGSWRAWPVAAPASAPPTGFRRRQRRSSLRLAVCRLFCLAFRRRAPGASEAPGRPRLRVRRRLALHWPGDVPRRYSTRASGSRCVGRPRPPRSLSTRSGSLTRSPLPRHTGLFRHGLLCRRLRRPPRRPLPRPCGGAGATSLDAEGLCSTTRAASRSSTSPTSSTCRASRSPHAPTVDTPRRSR